MSWKWKNNRVILNTGWLLFGKMAQVVIHAIVSFLSVRYLGPSNYGLISYAGAYTSFFTAICNLGINSVLVNELLEQPDKEGEIMGTTFLFQGISSLLSAITILLFVYLADDGDPLTMLVVALSSIGMVFRTFETFDCWFRSKLQAKVSALVSLFAYVIVAVYKVILLVLGKPVQWFAMATAIDYLCVAAFYFGAYQKNHGPKMTVSLSYGKALLKRSHHFILSGLMTAIYAQVDKIMLKQMIHSAELGFYATAISVSSLWCFVLSAIITSMYTEITAAYKSDEELFLRRNRQLYAIVFYLSMAVSLVFTFAGKPILFILFGKEYLPAAGPLRVITWYTAFSYLGVAREAWVVCKNRQRHLKWVYLAAVLSNVILNLVLIPQWGAVGAAVASLIAQIVTTMVAPVFIKGLRENTMIMLDAIRLKDILPKKT